MTANTVKDPRSYTVTYANGLTKAVANTAELNELVRTETWMYEVVNDKGEPVLKNSLEEAAVAA